MAVRLRPQSAAWMAPHALAAQLNAQAGEVAGQGVAGLLGGIAKGVGAYTQARDRRQEMAINESRYQDSLMRQDRAFKIDAIQTQLGVMDKYIAGVRAEADLAALESQDGTLPPALTTKIDAALNSRKGLAAQAAMLAGVPAFEEPTVDTSTPRLTPQPEMPAPPNRPSMTKGDAAVQMGEVYSKMSREELVAKKAQYATAIAEASRRLDAIKKIDPARAARASVLTSAIDEANAKMLVIDDQLARRAEDEKRSNAASGKAPETVELGTPAKERSERDKVLDATRYAMSLGYEGAVFPNIEAANAWIKDRQITDPNSAAAATRKAEAARVRAENQQKLVDYRLKASKALADHVASIKEPAARAKAMQTAIENQQQLVKELRTKYEMLKSLQGKGLVGENDPDVVGGPGKPSAYDQYEAENDLLTEMVKQSLNVSAPVASDPKAAAAAELKALPPQQQTPEKWAEIKAKYGIK